MPLRSLVWESLGAAADPDRKASISDRAFEIPGPDIRRPVLLTGSAYHGFAPSGAFRVGDPGDRGGDRRSG
jgi:hypothetical protein